MGKVASMKFALPALFCLLALTACAAKRPVSLQRAAQDSGQWLCQPDAKRQGWDCIQGAEAPEAAAEPPAQAGAAPSSKAGEPSGTGLAPASGNGRRAA